ncbi:MAG: ribbon-helix-helix protein, CopG family [Sulfolobales archaeon]|jgi:metal-responsive CopG/Arc/MetJ family transcriptional regulator
MSGKRIRVISFKLQEQELIELDNYAERKGLSRSEVIREALYRLIREEGNGNKDDDKYLSIDFISKKIKSDTHNANETGSSNNGSKANNWSNIRKHVISVDCYADHET